MTNPGPAISQDELALVNGLMREIETQRFELEIRDAYYNGTFRVRDLGISVPPQLRNLHTVMGWPRTGTDAIEERLDIEGFRYPGATDADEDLWDIWQANNLDSEAPLAHLDALVFGHCYISVGSGVCGPGGDCPPLISVESPMDMAVDWDPRSRQVMAALRLYDPQIILGVQGIKGATLYLPETTTHMVLTDTGHWEIVDQDIHNLGIVPVVRMSNRQRTANRLGASEITPEIMSITDAACRTLLGLQVAGEFYSAPQRAILGAKESSFQNPDGSPKSGWETYLGRVLALERDEEGNLPAIHEMKAYDPSVYTKVFDMYAKIMTSLTGLPPHYLGYTTDNPASADAIRSTEARLVKRIERKQAAFSGAWEEVMQLALLIRDGTLSDKARRLETVWSEAGTATIAETSDAITKQIQVGAIPAYSDVTLEKLGYTFAERERLDIDRQADIGATLLAELATSLQAKEARVDKTIATDINPAAVKGAPVVDPTTGKATVLPATPASSSGTSKPFGK